MHASLFTFALLSLSLSVPSTLAGPSNHGNGIRAAAHRRHHARSNAFALPAGQPINSPARRARVERAAAEAIKRVKRVASDDEDDEDCDGDDTEEGSPAGSGLNNSTELISPGSASNSSGTSTSAKACTEGDWACSGTFLKRALSSSIEMYVS